METYSFVHAADLHLDSPFKGIKRVAPNIAEILQQATFLAFDSIINLCINHEVDALLVAGDIFDSADNSLTAQLRFIEGLQRLESAGIRSFICHGNHDPLDSWHAKIAFPSTSFQFGSSVTSIPLRPDDSGSPIVYGYSYPIREVRDNVIPKFKPAIEQGRIGIGLLHANVGSDTGHDSYAPCTISDLASLPIKYWALGHVHTRAVFNLPDDAGIAVYPGNIQGRHINEKGAKGAYLVKITGGSISEHSFFPTDVVRWDQIDIDIASFTDQDSLEADLEKQIGIVLDNSDGRHVVYRTSLSGRGDLHSLVSTQDYRNRLQDKLNEEWAGRGPFAYCDRVTANTRRSINREDLLKGEDFLGDLLRLFDQELTGDQPEGTLPLDLNGMYERNRLKKYLSDQVPNGNQLADLIHEAESICLDLLVSEDAVEN